MSKKKAPAADESESEEKLADDAGDKPAEAEEVKAASKKKAQEELIHGVKPYKAKRGEEYMNPAQQDHFRKTFAAFYFLSY